MDSKPLTDEEIAVLHGFADTAIARFGSEELCGVPGPQLLRLLDFATATRALLKRIEWSGAEPDFDEDYAAACPVCRELKSPHAEHKPDCELAALIGAKP